MEYFNGILLISLLTIINTIQTINETIDYCTLTCDIADRTFKHTVCERNHICNGSASCRPILPRNFRNWVLNAHHERRNYVAMGSETHHNLTAATNMHMLRYNEQLEYMAACHVNTCPLRSDLCRITHDYPVVGQNLYHGPVIASVADVERVVQHWYDDVAKLQPGSIDAFAFGSSDVSTTSYFTQMIWADSYQIGCALSQNMINSRRPYTMACNYAPGGNRVGEPVYKRGEPCTDCGKYKCHRKYRGLCSRRLLVPDKSNIRIASMLLTFLSCFMVYLIT